MIYRTSLGAPFWRTQSPFDELERLQRQMDTLFRSISDRSTVRSGAGVFPLINLTETPENYLIRAELPGMNGDELDLQVAENTLNISGERKFPSENEKARYHRREREAGKFSRAVAMPGDIDGDKIKATLANGILTVVVPKAAKSRPRQIAIK